MRDAWIVWRGANLLLAIGYWLFLSLVPLDFVREI
jgi:hypothetical protein